jgi:hypothetical protein
MVDVSRERQFLCEVQECIPPGSTRPVFRVRSADDGDGVQVIAANREVALSAHMPRSATIELVQMLCEYAGLPEPWSGRNPR